jgi:four helix bundle protein
MKERSLSSLKSKKFAVRIYKLSKYLIDEKKEFILAKQLLRAGTSIGANLSEAQYAISKKDFTAKISIALKECAETEYWLELLKDTGILSITEYESILPDCKDILKLLISTVKTLKSEQDSNR